MFKSEIKNNHIKKYQLLIVILLFILPTLNWLFWLQ